MRILTDTGMPDEWGRDACGQNGVKNSRRYRFMRKWK